MMANGNAKFIKFDAAGGSGTIGSGTMEKVDTTAYNTAKITGDYSFGVAGLDHLNNRAAIAGRFTSNGAGTLTNAAGDVNAYGATYSMSFTAANYTVSNAATGRGTLNLAFTFGGAPARLNFVFYIVNAGKLFAMERDAVTTATPLLNGVAVQQHSPAGGFSNASLNGNMVIYLTGLSTCGGGASGVPKAVAGLLSADGKGAFTLTYDENYCRAPHSRHRCVRDVQCVRQWPDIDYDRRIQPACLSGELESGFPLRLGFQCSVWARRTPDCGVIQQ
jgi:hypothetical protein